MDIHRDGNLIEAGVWFVAGSAVLFKAFRDRVVLRKTLVLLAVTLVLFGISDLVEIRTGAWWQPWWLLIWKTLCVLALLLLFIRYFRLRGR